MMESAGCLSSKVILREWTRLWWWYNRVMPAYEMQCRVCKGEFEVTCRMEDRELPVDCPWCGRRGSGQRVYSSYAHKWQQKLGEQSLAEIKGLTEQSEKRWKDMQ